VISQIALHAFPKATLPHILLVRWSDQNTGSGDGDVTSFLKSSHS